MGLHVLKTNTATRITVGPFLDKTDGVTPETALTVTSCKLTMMADISGVPTLQLDTNPTASGGNNDMVHVTNDDGGFYDLELTATNLNFIGFGRVLLTDAATHCPVWEDLWVVPAHVFDAWHNTVGVAPIYGIVDQGTLQSATGTTAVIRAAAAFGDDVLNGATLVITGGTGAGQRRIITDFVGATDTCTVDTWGTNPDSTSTYIIFGSAPASTSVPMPTNVTQWLGTAVATPTVAGVPEVDLTHIAGSAVSTSTAQLGVNVVTHTGNTGVKKNTALPAFMFQMFDSTTHAPATGKTPAVTRSVDGGAFGAGTLSAVTEVSGGWYKCDFGAGDLNGNVIAFRATAAACDDTNISIITGP